jgi:hypothetical protein
MENSIAIPGVISRPISNFTLIITTRFTSSKLGRLITNYEMLTVLSLLENGCPAKEEYHYDSLLLRYGNLPVCC